MKNGKSLKVIQRWMEEAAVRSYYDRIYALHLYMSGDSEAIYRAIEGRALHSVWSTDGDLLPQYPEIDGDLSPDGFANHGMVNSRINVQGLTMEPELIVSHPDPVVREYVSTFFRNRWEAHRYQDEFYQTGMEVEAGGVGHTEAGLARGQLAARHSPVLDTLWDRANKSPARWGWYAMRDRLTPERCLDVYGDAITQSDLDRMKEQEDSLRNERGSGISPMEIVTEWRYYDGDDHVVILGSARGTGHNIFLGLNDRNEYRQITHTADSPGYAGPNPLGVVPVSSWVDSWAPSRHRPVGKAETTIRIAAILNEVELFMIETLRNGAPITSVDGARIDKQLSDQIRKAKSWRALSKIIVTKGGSIKEVLSRTDPAVLANTVVILRAALKEELNASTGTMDMMRGQALQGERTKAEIDSLNNHAGIQGQHFRRQFARHIEDWVRVARPIAAQYDRADTTLMLPTFGRIKTSEIPVRLFMEEECPITISPASLVYKTEQDRKNEAILELNQFHLPFIQLGVEDPKKALAIVGKKYGFRDPITELGFDPAQLAAAAGQAAVPGQAPAQQAVA